MVVDPKAITNNSSRIASTMLISDRRLTPFSTPSTTDAVAIAVITMISTIFAVVDVLHSKRKWKPAAACSAPMPSDVASPKNVARTARTSMICPGHPQTRSPKMG